MNRNYKPKDFYEFCDSLNQPYARAKQYFEDAIFDVDIYKDRTYFYDWYSKLDYKSQDLVFNNLNRIYDVTKEISDRDFKNTKKSLKKHTNELSEIVQNQQVDLLKETISDFKSLSSELEIRYKLSIISELLSTIESYRRVVGAVNKKDYLKNRQDDRKYFKKLILYSMIFIASLTIILVFIIMYLIFKIGIVKYTRFMDSVILPIILTSIIGFLLSGFNIYKKFFESN